MKKRIRGIDDDGGGEELGGRPSRIARDKKEVEIVIRKRKGWHRDSNFEKIIKLVPELCNFQ
jgi:hypothetical protein